MDARWHVVVALATEKMYMEDDDKARDAELQKVQERIDEQDNYET